MSVYFAIDRFERIKIGYSRNPQKRVQSLATAVGDGTISIVRIIDGGRPTEKWMHRKFKEHRISGEWFRFDPLMLTVIAPDELPIRRKPLPPRASPGEFFRLADQLGLLSDRMRTDYAPFLSEKGTV